MERANPKFSHLPSPIPLRLKSLKSPTVFILIRDSRISKEKVEQAGVN